ncbi:MAG: CCA tRNA nucleotidyltransferase [Gomphosphaeria aponina SAG 52.96 = DSM 107014]|uniref:CCA tRNA nucleotidyltransferase n=1 Tax=Gomphosphaeria aponina SAG 52.96 = DSM 107014 TaxID=1521640 RepID=A0A941JSK8_9CHRO|nr:CCA tRNA nucleotidyltransferase [Gomphosphaeria aponina SAG 52.96 = DSM 107014]
MNLSPKNWPFSLDWLPQSAYLVGGTVRDALLNRKKENLDLDFVVPKLAIQTGQRIAKHYRAGFVILDEERKIARVVFNNATIDFAEQEGGSLEADLRRRDFTVNAIAYNPYTQEVMDPLQGLKDLEKSVIRMISKKNLEDDPLRLLRAYRLAAQLNFTIEPKTQSILRSLAPLITKVAAERVQAELKYLLTTPLGSKFTVAATEDKVLQKWFKNATKEKVQQLSKIDEAAVWMAEKWSEFSNKSGNWYELAKLATLVSEEVKTAELELINLKYSRSEIRAVTTAIKNLPILLKPGSMNLKEQYLFFYEVGNMLPILAVMAVAYGGGKEKIIPIINRYLDPNDQVAHPQPLITGNDLMTNLNLPPTPKIGKLLTDIQIARIEGKISTPEEAINLAKSLVH